MNRPGVLGTPSTDQLTSCLLKPELDKFFKAGLSPADLSRNFKITDKFPKIGFKSEVDVCYDDQRDHV